MATFRAYNVAVTQLNSILVGTEKWERGQRGDALYIETVQDSIGVLLSNVRSGDGLAGVFTADSMSYLAHMVQAAQQESQHLSDVRLWYTGAVRVAASESSHELNVKTEHLRMSAADILRGSGFVTVFWRWLAVGTCADMSLVCGQRSAAVRIRRTTSR